MDLVLVLSGVLVGLVVGFLVARGRGGSGARPGGVEDTAVGAGVLGESAQAESAGVTERPVSALPREGDADDALATPLEAGEGGAPEVAAGELSAEELTEQELERLAARAAELSARVEELESQLRRLRRWAGAQLQRSAELLQALWKREKLPNRVHEMGRQPAAEVLEQVRELAEPLGEWSQELGLGGADVHYWLGLWHALEGRPAAAVEAFEQGIRKGLDGESQREAMLGLGDALWLLDRRKKARDAYRRVLDRKRVPAVVLHRCAQVAFEERSYQEALTHLDPVLERKQTPIEAFAMASLAAGKLGDHARAVAFCEAGLKKHPDTPLLLASMIIPLGQQGQRDRMEEVYARARELDPDLAEAPFSVGVVKLHDGDIEAATELFNEALALRPEYAEAFFCLGVIHNRRGDYRRALELFRRAVELKPDYAEAYYNMKDSYDGLRDFESSIAMLKKAVQLNPEYR